MFAFLRTMQRPAVASADEGPGPRRTNPNPVEDPIGTVQAAEAEISAAEGDGERAQLREALREATDRVQAATRAKSEFLATMSHEMRTPLNAVLGYTELLSLGVPGTINDAQRSYLDRIQSASSRLLSLINDVLDLTKIDAGRMIVAQEPVRSGPIVRRAVAALAQRAAECEIELESRCEDGAAFMGDGRRVAQVVQQLLANAIRFSPRGGKVSISCTRFGTPEAAGLLGPSHRCWCAIRVEDTGIGIDARHQGAIFDPFVQVESGHTRTYEGSGLGLAIGRRLARLMGGDLTVTSSPGSGSAFTLWLPAPPTLTVDGEETDSCTTTERRSDARQARGLTETGDVILRDLDGMVRRLTARLRADDALPGASALDDALLEEHTATLLADIAQSLSIIEESGGKPTQLMRDGGDIQSLIASRHGHHRQRLGWSEAQLDREYDVLLEEVDRAIDVGVEAERASPPAGRDLVRGFIGRAREESRRAYRRAGVGEPPERPPVAD
jgi:signal transduction histidine kinase